MWEGVAERGLRLVVVVVEMGSHLVLSIFSNRSHPRERTRNESPLEKNSPGHCKKKTSFFCAAHRGDREYIDRVR